MSTHQESFVVARQARIEVLLVEDNEGDALLVRYMLQEAVRTRFEVSHTPRLEDALERLREKDFDVVLLDLTLPDAHGLDTVARIREAAPQLPVVVLSGVDDEEVALRALHGGAQDYLVKGQGDGDLVSRAIRYAIERKRAEERVIYMSQYDHLTGLANRALFEDRLRQASMRAERDGTLVALLIVDLDRFKAINDSFGHGGGDALLKKAAARVRDQVRESDTVARIGADEFGVVVEGMPEAWDVAPLAGRIVDAFSDPFSLNGHEVYITASLGIAVKPPSDQEDLMSHATAAVNEAKQNLRGAFRFYTPGLNVRAFERMAFETSLKRALEREEFVLHYQPQVDLETGRVAGAEALIRWQHPDLGLVPPARFIPVLEETGLIVPVGEWVLRTACADARCWREAGIPPLRVAVNLSARQFGHEGLARAVSRVVRQTELEAFSLELELTESVLMEDTLRSASALDELKRVPGLKLAIDDFGTGYSSLSYLKRFPLDVLKIDRTFVRDIATDPADAAIVAAIIGLAHNLRLRVIAEGVETAEQLSYLREKGCDEIQGYFCRPRDADAFADLLLDGSPLLDFAGHPSA